MSALFLMCRMVISRLTLGLALAAIAVACAHAAQYPAPAKRQRATVNAHRLAHRPHGAKPAGNERRAATAQTRARRRAGTAQIPSPRNTGRTAGLAIRRQLAQQHAARHAVALRRERAPIPQTNGERSSREPKETHETSPIETASASVFLLPSLAAEPSELPDAAERDADRNAPAKAGDDDATQEMTPATRPESAALDTNAEPEEASLRIPRGATPAPLRGSLESLERQNERLDAEGLERIEDEADLADRIEHKLLVPIPASDALTVNAELPAAHRYCRPWTAAFLSDLAQEHGTAFHRPLEVSSAVRTIEYQKRLMRTNGNAAAAEGDIVSPHLTGATVDIAKDGLSRAEIYWMRRHLLALETAGDIDVEEEFHQSCFHITVYKTYAPQPSPDQARSETAPRKRHKRANSTAAANRQGL